MGYCLNRMAGVDEDFIYQEDTWICIIRQNHELFCTCASWLDHLRKLLDYQHPGWLGESQDRQPGAAENGDQSDAPTDAELIAAMEELENGDPGEGTSRSEL